MANAQNLTLVINVGRWMTFERGDVRIYNGFKPYRYKSGVKLFAILVQRFAELLQTHLRDGSIAIWIGANTRPEDKIYCGDNLHPWSKPIVLGLSRVQVIGPRRNFFVD